MGAKWLQLLKDTAPTIDQVVILYNPLTTPHFIFLRPMESVASTLGIKLLEAPVHSAEEISAALKAFDGKPNVGVVALPDTFLSTHRKRLIALVNQYKLPTIYPFRYFISGGGLLSYGVETVEIYRQSASYVDKILKSAKPSELPIQGPTAFNFVVNLKTAVALGLTFPAHMLMSADEVIG